MVDDRSRQCGSVVVHRRWRVPRSGRRRDAPKDAPRAGRRHRRCGRRVSGRRLRPDGRDGRGGRVSRRGSASLYGDVASCGLGARPWENPPGDRAVFDHVRGRWIPPRRWIPYDGSPADLLVDGALAIPLIVFLEGSWHRLTVALLVVSIGYTITRKRLEDVARWSVRYLPPSIRRYVPERYVV
ncbi:hypothetical protein [Natrarchaeobius chitinivorans]|uniref:hypothetical protein n=1 Tax=Natrarchaeobius chitinivorans TaxID=1679083 RepID=UPI00311E7D41